MRNIIVVDCQSTGINFIQDIVNNGYNPIILELNPEVDDIDEYKQKMEQEYEKIQYDFKLIYEKDSFNETLNMVRKLKPAVIVAGSSDGVYLATKLSDKLGLLSNRLEDLDAITSTEEMQKRLKENNLRYIKSKKVTTLSEALDFYDDQSLDEVILKADSIHKKLCFNKDEFSAAAEEFFKNSDDKLLIEEHINGEEYILNTASCNATHLITTIWKYNKLTTREGSIIYDSIESVNELDIGEAELIDYAYDVCDALKIQYGPLSGEYIIDEKGPVLIEAKCCPMAGHLSSEFLDKVSGQHETNSILDSYLNSDHFLEKRKQKYRLPAYGAFKTIIVPEDIIARSAPMNNIGPRLESFHDSLFDDLLEDEKFYPKTEDENTTCGLIFLVNEDYSVIHHDLKFLRSVERNAFDLVLSAESEEKLPVNLDIIVKKLKLLINMTQKYGNGLFITDQIIQDMNIMQVRLEDIEKIQGEFDYVIVNLNKSFIEKSDYISIDILLDVFSHLKVDGFIFIPDTTYRYVPGGRKGVEALLKALNLRIEVPPYGIKYGVIASKEN